MSDKSCDNCQLKECDLSDCMSRGCGGGPTYPGHLPVKVACPLPRIGSKDWGWTWNRKTEKYESKHCKYWLDPSGASDGAAELFEVMFQGEHHFCTIGSYMLLSDAKRFAELLARRDWRRENRGKNG